MAVKLTADDPMIHEIIRDAMTCCGGVFRYKACASFQGITETKRYIYIKISTAGPTKAVDGG